MLLGALFQNIKQAIYFTTCHSRRIQNSARFIMTSSSALDKAMDTLEKNPYYEKYQQRILELQKENPETLVSRWKDYNTSKEKKLTGGTAEGRKMSTLSKPKEDITSRTTGITKQKVLDDVMKVDLIKDKTADEITQIWTDYFKSRDGIVAVVPKDNYVNIQQKVKSHPVFVFPLPRSQGYEFIMCQASGNELHFTSLINFQAFKENAPECLTMVYYTDLMLDKGIVLMRGEFDKNVLNPQEATCLANQVQLYYGENNDKRDRLMSRFTNAPQEFKHMDLIAELECLTF